MLSYMSSRRSRPGAPPGDLVDPPPHQRIGSLSVYRMAFGGSGAAVSQAATTFDAALTVPADDDHPLLWLHFEGDVSAAELARLGERFTLHPLALEDVLNHGQRPKLDTYRQTLFATLALPHMVDDELVFQQVSLFIGEDFVLSFHAGTHDVFGAVRERIHAAHGRIAHAEPDYLGYCLADVVVDTSFEVLAGYNDHLEVLEDAIFENRRDDLVGPIHELRRRLIGMRKILLSQNELFVRWIGLEHPLIHADNRPYFRDVQDHARRVVDLADGYYETAGSLLDTHLSLASARLNDVMRVLTLIATIFMPLSFLAGIYGMNFDTHSPWNMPELSYRYGYPLLLGVMGALVVGMLVYFRRKQWI
ncbi:magnesium/cobalt transporter CorA [Salinisphaera sp. Q1T1-3]|uniref:magnesium/cobalt transporter CorA n=1 Tax=Salinisphaera sp. Q1T1-3 TaxID=2321229 RepID=UPI000E712CB0|nr:magnesium/cobalt transporter CorA [Salinisphaera sp. Q1T1-3]RJS94326.1 magnesium and cobalt transport protein CorA [Salinisphaera sp. Q1T1-3]